MRISTSLYYIVVASELPSRETDRTILGTFDNYLKARGCVAKHGNQFATYTIITAKVQSLETFTRDKAVITP